MIALLRRSTFNQRYGVYGSIYPTFPETAVRLGQQLSQKAKQARRGLLTAMPYRRIYEYTNCHEASVATDPKAGIWLKIGRQKELVAKISRGCMELLSYFGQSRRFGIRV